jgi:RHS repeat-associated protein
LGSTVLTTSSLDATHNYYAYGKLRGYTGSFPTRHQFTGQYIDDTGLYYYGARYYDREIGAFLSPDTIVPDASNLFDYNRYMMVRGNPLKYNDPTGHQAACTMDADLNWQCSDNAVTGGETLDIDPADDTHSNNPNGTRQFLTTMGTAFAIAFTAPVVAGLLPTACGDGDCTNEINAATSTTPKLGQLRSVGQNIWESTAGLRYGPDPTLGNRVQHVLKHTVDDIGRAKHGVFTTGRSETLSLIDEAWQSVQQNSSKLINIIPQGNRTVYEIDMGRQIGYLGGREGAALGNPATNVLRLVVQGSNEVITAFPVIQ